MSEPGRLDRWLPHLIDGLATSGIVYLFFYIALQFRDDLILLPLLVGAVAATLAGPGRIRPVLRGVLLYPLLAFAVLISPLATLVSPWSPAVAALAFGAPLALRFADRRRRLICVLLWMLAALPAVIVPLLRQPSSSISFVILWGLATATLALFALRPEANARPLAVFILALLLPLTPPLAARNLPCNASELGRIVAQDGVEKLFDNQTSLDLPPTRMEMLCDPASGVRVVTPHAPSKRLGFLDPDGKTRTMVLLGDASIKSAVHDGKLYTGPKGYIHEIDVRTGDSRRGPRLMRFTIGDLRLDPQSGLITMIEDQSGYCHLGRADTLAGAGHLPMRLPGACIPLSGEEVLISEAAWPGRRLRRVRVADSAVLAETKLVDLGFLEVAVDRPRGLVYAPSTVLGRIVVLELQTLAERGVRGVLVDPAGDRLFAWNYFDGILIEHALPGGEITRRWFVGSPLRKVNWDCDGRHLLAVSCLGGFRIDPEG